MLIRHNLFDKASGSIGRFTGSNSRGGLMLRRKPQTIQNYKANQVLSQQYLINAQASFDKLSAGSLTKWTNYARTLIYKGPTDNDYTFTARQAYCRCYVLHRQAKVITDDLENSLPLESGFYTNPVFINQLYISPNGFVFAWNNSYDFVGKRMMFFISPVQKKSILVYRGGYNNTGNTDFNDLNFIIIPHAPVVGRYFFKFILYRSRGETTRAFYGMVDID